MEKLAMEKVSITLDADVVAAIRERVGKRGFSAYVNDALRRQLRHDGLRQLLDEMDEELGPIPPDVREAVNAEPWGF